MKSITLIALVILVAAPKTASAADWERKGLAWRLELSNGEVQNLKASAAVAKSLVPDPEVQVAITAAVGVIDLTNELGGRKGVEISGIIGYQGIFIWPKGKSTPFTTFVAIATEIEKTGNKLEKHWGGIISGVGDKLDASWRKAFGQKTNNVYGRLKADRNSIGPWEKFRLVTVRDNDSSVTGILGHTGFVSLTDGSVYTGIAAADRAKMEAWERFRIDKNDDGTVSLYNLEHKKYLTTRDLDSKSFSTTQQIYLKSGHCVYFHEKKDHKSTHFSLVYNDDGTVSLKSWEGKYVAAEIP